MIAQIARDGGACFVDGGIVGPPPSAGRGPRLYLAGERADTVAGLFGGMAVDARVIGGDIGAASAVKMAYAAWTKGSAALVLASRALARTWPERSPPRWSPAMPWTEFCGQASRESQVSQEPLSGTARFPEACRA